MGSWSVAAYLPSLFLAARFGDAACLALFRSLLDSSTLQYGDEELPRQAARGSAAPAGSRRDAIGRGQDLKRRSNDNRPLAMVAISAKSGRLLRASLLAIETNGIRQPKAETCI